MTSNDTNIRASFRNLDTPVAVDPAFTNRVHQSVAILHGDMEPTGLTPIPTTQYPIPTLQPATSSKRFRWQDLAAAAVLLLALAGLITGAIRVLRTDEPGSIVLIDAPQTPALGDSLIATPASNANIPVINVYRSAANDGNLPGVMPPPGTTYDLLWEGPEPDLAFTVPTTYIAGDVVVSVTLVNEPMTDLEPFLSVRDLATGEELWRTTIDVQAPVSITPQGILIGSARYAGGRSTIGFTLLDLHTGDEIWSTEPTYTSNDFPMWMTVVDGDTIYVLNGETNTVALDLATGDERWTFDAAQGRTREEMLGECIPTNPDCGQRVYQSAAMTIVGDMAYRYVPISGELVAINTADGSLRWVHNLAERTSIPAPSVRLIGTEWGVLPIVREGPSTTEGHYLGFWQATDGAEIWTKAVQVGSAYVVPYDASDALIFSRIDPENPSECCLITTIDIRTGDALLDDATIPLNGEISIFPSDGTLRLLDWSAARTDQNRVPPTSFVFPSSGFANPVSAEQLIPGCASITPGTDGQHVVCYLPNGQFAIYQADEIPQTVEPTQVSGPITEGCFEKFDEVRVIENGVNMRQAPAIPSDILRQLEIGYEVMIVADDAFVDLDGTSWCYVRDPETAVVGYIAEEFLELVEP